MTVSGVSAPRALGVAIVIAFGAINAADSIESALYLPAAPPPAIEEFLAPPMEQEVLPVEMEVAPAAVWPPERETVTTAVQATWPEDVLGAVSILLCESDAGQHPDTYNLDAANAGPMQINHDVWAAFFEAGYGWPWEVVVTDLDTHLQAARIVYERAGGWFAWSCW